MVGKEVAEQILRTYEEAWVNQDVEKILSIFTENATYSEETSEKPFTGHKEIGEYWTRKVVEEQSEITFKLLNMYIDGDTVIAEWDASFNSNRKGRIHIREVAIMEIENGKIRSLREYWHLL